MRRRWRTRRASVRWYPCVRQLVTTPGVTPCMRSGEKPPNDGIQPVSSAARSLRVLLTSFGHCWPLCSRKSGRPVRVVPGARPAQPPDWQHRAQYRWQWRCWRPSRTGGPGAAAHAAPSRARPRPCGHRDPHGGNDEFGEPHTLRDGPGPESDDDTQYRAVGRSNPQRADPAVRLSWGRRARISLQRGVEMIMTLSPFGLGVHG